MEAKPRKVAFIHASPAAIDPLARFYREAAPELETTNLLDDGLLRFFALRRWDDAEQRLAEMIAAARAAHDCELAMLTCSAVPRGIVENLRPQADFPILRIDDALARRAVQTGGRIGLVVSFPPTLETTRELLNQTALELGVSIEILPELVPEAYHALLAGESQRHDELVVNAVARLDRQGAGAIVLAQVSMGCVLPQLKDRIGAPVLSSLHTSLDAIRATLGEL